MIRIAAGKRNKPLWTHVYAPEGLGKTTFAAGAPGVVFIDVEQGSNNLDVSRFQFDDAGRTHPDTWDEFLDALRSLVDDKHDFQTVAIDTLDAVEPLLWASICKRDGKENVEAYGYGKGYVAALDGWRILVSLLERLRARGLHVVTLGHSVIKSFNNPEGENYDRYIMKLHSAAAGLIKERADCVLFGRLETFATKGKGELKAKAISSGARVLHATRTAAFDAKNRHDLPDQIPLSWVDYWAAIQAHQPAEPAELVTEITRKAADLGGDIKKKAATFVAAHLADAAGLAQLNNRLNAKLAEREQKESKTDA
jgi:hypothetical protein